MIQANSVVQENGFRTGLDWVKRKITPARIHMRPDVIV
jgi:hypothetical protein